MRTKSKLTGLSNKGIAMISIIIAVAFVSVIGSALLYITYANFQMKVLNLNSKTNYYETDGELIKITAGIRNSINTPADVDALLPGLTQDSTDTSLYSTSTVKLDGVDGILGKSGIVNSGTTYTDEKGDTFYYSASGAEKRIEGNITRYTIKDLKVKQVSKDHYSNSVKTNLEIKVLKQTGGAGGKKGLGECSMLSDCPVSIDSNNFSFVTFFGDTYFSSYYYGSSGNQFGTFPGYNGTGTYTIPGKYGTTEPGLKLSGDGKMNLEADHLVVYGDLVLEGDSCLNINGGNLTVYGDIYIMGNATLLCSGNIYLPESILPGRGDGDRCRFKSAQNVDATKDYLKKHLYYGESFDSAPYVGKKISDDSFKAFTKTIGLDNNKKDDDGVARTICKKFKLNGNDYSIFEYTNSPEIVGKSGVNHIDSTFYGEKCGVAFFMGGANVGNVAEWTNYICFIANGNGQKTNINGSNVSSTFVSVTPIYLNVQSGIYFSKLGSNTLNYLTVPHESTTEPYYDTSIHKVKLNWNGKMPGITTDAMGKGDFSAGDFLNSDKDLTIQNMWSSSVNNSSGAQVKYINSSVFVNYVKDVE